MSESERERESERESASERENARERERAKERERGREGERDREREETLQCFQRSRREAVRCKFATCPGNNHQPSQGEQIVYFNFSDLFNKTWDFGKRQHKEGV